MVVAAVLMLSRTVGVWSVLAAVGAVVATLTLVRIAVVRRIRPEETRRIDTSLQVAYMDAAPVVREAADLAQREVLAELGPERAAQVVRVRTAVVDGSRPHIPRWRRCRRRHPPAASSSEA